MQVEAMEVLGQPAPCPWASVPFCLDLWRRPRNMVRVAPASHILQGRCKIKAYSTAGTYTCCAAWLCHFR